MIAVDTSALLAIILDEPEGEACIVALESSPVVLMSAGTMAEALIVADRKGVRLMIESIFARFDFEILPVTAASARRAAAAYGRWGKGVHPAALNMGDCFAYEAAREHGCPLLYIGNDFARTDITSAL
ncbi:type II toxin-antitoxin system VapC family toxin [Sphingomonas naphthae]|uniref:Ribonuclease VapC n=1 Tax=Sphingomonas naphthae TaxID=1813468 RepID=A0ABY7TN45_9SPHN|nr:type II toxin-antitoxin system VapC family toxin [Sphingomonas naphthae]WCT73825.1 type II toxin-antitoxin system VapC family toxin [Sphingomonas naphthae]